MGYQFENGERYRDGKPFFSIGVTTYDRVSMLAETLSSILAQTFEDFEVIVGNDNPDRILSGEVLGINDPRVRFVNYPKNLGELGNMNSMLNMSRGKFFTWLADDDLYAQNFLEAVYSSLVKFNYPLCVSVLYKIIESNSSYDLTSNFNGKENLYSGRQFLRMYLSGKLKAIGPTNVYNTEYLKKIGGVEKLCEGPIALHSEYLLLLECGLLERIAHINIPLIFFRANEQSYQNLLELEDWKNAGENLFSLSIEIFKKPALRDDFQQNLFYVLKLSMDYVVVTASKRPETFSVRDMLTYFFSLKAHLISLKKSDLYKAALLSWSKAGVCLIWSITKATFKMKAPHSLKKIAYKILSFFRRQKTRPN